MTDFLIFTIYAPLASWGDIAVGELRGSWDRPSRSAVLGLLGAALGLDRSDQEAHDALDQGYGVAVRLDRPGYPMVDYHTAQTVGQRAARTAAGMPRAALLEAGDLQTILSQRTYRRDALATIAVWCRQGALWSLEALSRALSHPKFILYAGRKANALGLPLMPELTKAESLAAALCLRPLLPARLAEFVSFEGSGALVEVSHDPCDECPSGLKVHRREVRRDAGAHRARWQFAERLVEVGLLDKGSVQ